MKRPALLLALVLLGPGVAHASFNGRIDFPPWVSFVFGVIGALPGAVVVLLLEWRCAAKTLPAWLGGVAALAAVYCGLRTVGLVGPNGDRGYFLLPIPPAIELVLITFVWSPSVRHATGWSVGAASLLLLGLAGALGGPTARVPHEAWWPLSGGAVTTALLWRIGFSLGLRSLRPPPEPPADGD